MRESFTTNSCDEIDISPKRKPKPTRRSLSGFYMFRGETAVWHESALERDFLVRKEFCLGVLRVSSQPVQIPFIDSMGRSDTYTPDYLVDYTLDGHAPNHGPKSRLVEVKEESEWRSDWRESLPKWKAAYRFAKEHHWHFSIQDESRIRDSAFDNIHFLERFKRMHIDVADSEDVLDLISTMGSAPMHHVLARLFLGNKRRQQGMANLWHLLATRKLDCDITLPLGEFTVFWVPNND